MTSANVQQLLIRAIRERRRVALRYHGQRGLRVVEPHAIYPDEQSQLLLDAYQVRGFSASGRPPPFWRPFRIKHLTDVESLPEVFVPRTAEGFSAAARKYARGLLAIVQAPAAAVAAPPEAALLEVGPPRPPHLRRPA